MTSDRRVGTGSALPVLTHALDGHQPCTMRRTFLVIFLALPVFCRAAEETPPLALDRDGHWLVISGPAVPGGSLRINYLEAYCRAGSTDADWVAHTVIPHRSETVSLSPDKRVLRLRDSLEEGLVVDHTITAESDAVDFRLAVRHTGARRSEAHWAQACVRLSAFCGFDPATAADAVDYLPQCFLFLDGRLTWLPCSDWATRARYTPGQVWRAPGVPAQDVNPRPLHPRVPDCGLIGARSADGRTLFATAWDPWQELFQGVARCLHADFRLGGLEPGATLAVHGRIYLHRGSMESLLARYRRDFPARPAPPGLKSPADASR